MQVSPGNDEPTVGLGCHEFTHPETVGSRRIFLSLISRILRLHYASPTSTEIFKMAIEVGNSTRPHPRQDEKGKEIDSLSVVMGLHPMKLFAKLLEAVRLDGKKIEKRAGSAPYNNIWRQSGVTELFYR